MRYPSKSQNISNTEYNTLLYFLMYKLGKSVDSMISLSVFNSYHFASTSFESFKLVRTKTTKT